MGCRHTKNGPDDNRMTMTRGRSRSDASLEQILQTQIVRDAFGLFLRAEFAEEKLLFWVDVQDFKNDQDPTSRMRKARVIFAKYLDAGSDMDVKIDSETRSDIEKAIIASSNSRQDMRSNLFDLAVEKVYQQLKFEYMPRFLLSPNFNSLYEQGVRRGENGELETGQIHISIPQNEKTEPNTGVRHNSSRKLTIHDVNLQEVLKRPTGQTMLKRFLSSLDDPSYEDLLHFYNEVEDYHQPEHNFEYRSKRATRMINRYFVEDATCCLLSHIPEDVVYSIRSEISVASATLFDEAQRHAFTILDIQFPNFKLSPHLQSVLQESEHEETFEYTIFSLNDFRQERGLSNVKTQMESYNNQFNHFDTMIQDSTGLAFFKRFLRTQFAEENLFFWLEVAEFKAGHFAAPSTGTVLMVAPGTSPTELMEMRARRLYEKYIVPGAKFEINLPSKIRQLVSDRIKDNAFELNMFDECQNEIYALLSMDTFKRFLEHPLFQVYRQTVMRKFPARHYSVY